MIRTALAFSLMLATAAHAADAPAVREGDVILNDFQFHTGEALPELRMHYHTVGYPAGQPVLILHGTGQSGAAMLAPTFGGVLFGPGQPLDAAKYFIILPDSIGAGQSSKPSDGLQAKFPAYDYDDAVRAQYLMVTQGLHLPHLRLVLGNSMGGMQTWLWAEQHPDFADAFVPMASQPTPMASRNWMLRDVLVQEVRHDPAAMHYAITMFNIATSGGVLGWQAQAPTAAKADAIVDGLLGQKLPDPNDFAYQWDSSHDFDAMPALDRITRPVLVINSADDERNPPQTGLMDQALARLPHAQYDLIPASAETRGHGTTGLARFWAERLREFLAGLPS
jgi:homoserine O-acetyltransferase